MFSSGAKTAERVPIAIRASPRRIRRHSSKRSPCDRLECSIATFEPKATKEQKDGLIAILTKIYPVKWTSVQMDTSDIAWHVSPDGKTAHAKLGNGKGEVNLTRFDGNDPAHGAIIQNVRYFAATWNSPFSLYHSDHYYKGFGKNYQLHHANGFTITVEASSDGKRVAAKKAD